MKLILVLEFFPETRYRNFLPVYSVFVNLPIQIAGVTKFALKISPSDSRYVPALTVVLFRLSEVVTPQRAKFWIVCVFLALLAFVHSRTHFVKVKNQIVLYYEYAEKW